MTEPTALSNKQKRQLHEVADGLLKVYRTLARMQYLQPSWIHEGPHDLSAHHPLYESLGLDASIIYLYSILPYVDSHGAEELDFFQGSSFADFREEIDVKEGRDPMWGDVETAMMRPWMTPLCVLGNHRSVIVYDESRHCIGVRDQESGGNCDWAFHNDPRHRLMVLKEREKADGAMGEGGMGREEAGSRDESDGDEEIESDQPYEQESDEGEEEGCEDGSAEDFDEDYEDVTDDEEEHEWDEMQGRPAPEFLRDMALWYEYLIELPGGGDRAGRRWDWDLVAPLYRKHGWPTAEFDGDAFLIDQARARAAAKVSEDMHYSAQDLNSLRVAVGRGQDEEMFLREFDEKVEAALSVDEEWMLHWKAFRAEQGRIRTAKELDRAEEAARHVSHRSEDIFLREVDILRQEIWDLERDLEGRRRETASMEEAGRSAKELFGPRDRISYLEKRVVTATRAYELHEAEAKRLYPDKTLPAAKRGVKSTGLDYEAMDVTHKQRIVDEEAEREALQFFLAQLPIQGAESAQTAAREMLDRVESILSYSRKAISTKARDS